MPGIGREIETIFKFIVEKMLELHPLIKCIQNCTELKIASEEDILIYDTRVKMTKESN